MTIYIQNDAPSGDKKADRLFALGPIYLITRLYWPKETPPSIVPPGDGLWQPPAVHITTKFEAIERRLRPSIVANAAAPLVRAEHKFWVRQNTYAAQPG